MKSKSSFSDKSLSLFLLVVAKGQITCPNLKYIKTAGHDPGEVFTTWNNFVLIFN